MNPSPADRADGIKAWRVVKRIVNLTYTAAASRDRAGCDELLMTTLPPAVVPANSQIKKI
jgi:hypothetical protein